jgi:hypothetical protein
VAGLGFAVYEQKKKDGGGRGGEEEEEEKEAVERFGGDCANY